MRRRVAITVYVLFSVLLGVVWEALLLAPPRLLLRYGLPSSQGPTGETLTIEGVEFVEISPGYFLMGSTHLAEEGDLIGRICKALGQPWGRQSKPSSEMPLRWVEFRHGFWIARTEVTHAQFEAFRPGFRSEPIISFHRRPIVQRRDRDPVVHVSWGDTYAYCAWLAEESRLPVRLPSEAEWECACRAGSRSHFCFGDGADLLSEYAWCSENSEGLAQPVATKRANAWGLCDMHGNVREWCEDTYHESYVGAPIDGSSWTEGGWRFSVSPFDRTRFRVCRGGSWCDGADRCRSAFRTLDSPGSRRRLLGFRPAFVPTPVQRARVVGR